jgi:fucose permease
MQASNDRTQLDPLQIGIILLTLATAFIHLYLSIEIIAQGMSGTLFILNGLGYLALLAGLFLPIPVVRNYRPLLRILFIVFTLVTILAWVAMGMRNIWGYSDKAVEILLVILLWLDRSRK